MTASLEVVNTSMHSRDALDYEDPLAKEEISDSSSDPPDSSEDWNVTKPGEHDVLLGRGGGTNNHMGNVTFRQLVNEHKMRYLACSKVEKPKVAREVVQLWRKMAPPGRFLARKDDSKRGPGSVKAADNVWFEVGDKKAREKASQCLRERTPEVMPYIKQLREQQDAATEQGVSIVQRQIKMHQESDAVHPMDTMSGYSHGAGAGVQQQAAFPRRNSMPAPPEHQQPFLNRRASLSSMQQGPSPQQQQQPYTARRTSMPGMMPGTHPDDFYNGQGPPQEEEFYGEMSDAEYEHMMMMQQQQLQMQHLQLQRMRLQRMRGGPGAAPTAPGVRRPTGFMPSQAAPMAQPAPFGAPSMGQHAFDNSGFHGQQQQQHQQPQSTGVTAFESDPLSVQQDPLLSMSSRGQQPRASTTTTTTTTKASRTKRSAAHVEQQVAVTPSPAKPDAVPSSMMTEQQHHHHEPAPAAQDGELTLEEYRQQLEEYMNNNQILDQPVDHPEDDQGANSDLEDDWEKERDNAFKKEKKRGVGRNVSGMSFMSIKSTKTDKSGMGMSLVSGMSNFSDIMSTATRDQKMNATRSVGSNLSLMSELTDLSQNIDDLHLGFDE